MIPITCGPAEETNRVREPPHSVELHSGVKSHHKIVDGYQKHLVQVTFYQLLFKDSRFKDKKNRNKIITKANLMTFSVTKFVELLELLKLRTIITYKMFTKACKL